MEKKKKSGFVKTLEDIGTTLAAPVASVIGPLWRPAVNKPTLEQMESGELTPAQRLTYPNFGGFGLQEQQERKRASERIDLQDISDAAAMKRATLGEEGATARAKLVTDRPQWQSFTTGGPSVDPTTGKLMFTPEQTVIFDPVSQQGFRLGQGGISPFSGVMAGSTGGITEGTPPPGTPPPGMVVKPKETGEEGSDIWSLLRSVLMIDKLEEDPSRTTRTFPEAVGLTMDEEASKKAAGELASLFKNNPQAAAVAASVLPTIQDPSARNLLGLLLKTFSKNDR